MELVECKECNKQISEDARICPGCGAKQRVNPALKLLIGVVVIFAAFLIFGATRPDDGRSQSRMAIEVCWKDQRRASLTPVESRFIAGVCEKLEDDFREKYRVNP